MKSSGENRNVVDLDMLKELSEEELMRVVGGDGIIAGSIGGKKYEICKSCNLVGVKVLSRVGFGSNDFSNINRGIDWVINENDE
jgi:bacteriocin-like protein